MSEWNAFDHFRVGLIRLRDGQPAEALPHIERAAQLELDNPFYLSYLGLVRAMTQERWADGEQLCSAAIKRKRTHPQLYLNLAEVYLRAGRKQDAVETLTSGLIFTNHDASLRRALGRLGRRRRPVLPFLDRGHFLNRALGRVRHRMRVIVHAA